MACSSITVKMKNKGMISTHQLKGTCLMSKQKLVIKALPYFITSANPIAKGLCYDTLLYSDYKSNYLMLTSKYFINKYFIIDN